MATMSDPRGDGESSHASSAQLDQQRKQQIRNTSARELMGEKKDLQEKISALQFSYYKVSGSGIQ